MQAETRNFFRSIGTRRFFLGVFLLAALGTADAPGQRRGNGGGSGGQTAWIEQFSDSLDGIRSRGWGIEQTGSPESRFGVPGVGMALQSFDLENVAIDSSSGMLSLKLTVTNGNGALSSSGALVYTTQIYGFGSYEWCMRMSSTATSPADFGTPVSGSVSAGFIYVNNSQTEIDFEQARAIDANGILRWWLYLANWRNLRLTYSRVEAMALPGNPAPPPTYGEFKKYKFDWRRDYVEFFVDDNKVAFHSRHVPQEPAHVMVNHWGTDRPDGFGGPAETGARYFYVDWVRYTPPGGLPLFAEITCPGSAPEFSQTYTRPSLADPLAQPF